MDQNKKGRYRAPQSSKVLQYDMITDMSKIMDIIMLQLSKTDKHAQVSIKEGIKRHGEEALVVLLK